jgi:hypothetical protein
MSPLFAETAKVARLTKAEPKTMLEAHGKERLKTKGKRAIEIASELERQD